MKNLIAESKYVSGVMAAVLCSIMMVCTSAEAKNPPPGVVGTDVAAEIMLMLDVSGSMGWLVDGDIEYPRDVAFDSSGNIYIATYDAGIFKYDTSGTLLQQWGTVYGTGNGEFKRPYSIAVDSSDNVYVSDGDNGRVQRFDSDGNYVSKFDVTTTYSRGVEVDSAGNVYVVNSSGVVEKHSADGTLLSTWSNSGAYYIDIDDSDDVYLAKYYSQAVQKYDTDGNYQSGYSLSFYPYGIAVDTNGDIYVGGYSNSGYVFSFTSGGSVIDTDYGYRYPRGLAFDSSRELHISDYYNHRITNLDEDIVIEGESRLAQMKTVIKSIVSNSDLTSGANFGLISWESDATMEVEISTDGASEIFDMIDSLTADGGTDLDDAMHLGKIYFLGSYTGNHPPISQAPACQQHIIIVVSDGEWSDTSASADAAMLYNNHGLETFAIGFQTTGNANYTTLSQAGGTYPDSPLFAETPETLLEVLTDYITSIISSNITFSAPTIVPGIENDDHILQSIFNYRSEHQWKGHFYKYALTDAGLLGDELWDAGAVLNARAADDRQIWTVGNGITTGLNNFLATSFDELRPSLEENVGTSYTDDELMDLINFVRGEDIYNEYPTGVDEDGITLLSGERWKLSDIYHSRASVVADPNDFYTDEAEEKSETYYRFANNYKTFRSGSSCGGTCSDREEVIYVGGNDGMLHAFASEDGEEKWAFVPPSVLPYFKDMISLSSGESTAIFGVDGSIAVKDVFYDSTWKTVLIGGLRQGGHSYFALDITDPDDPQHLFTFAFNPLTENVHYWAANGTETSYAMGNGNSGTTAPDEYDYSDLGEAWSQPVIIKAPVGTAGADKWVAIIGGGYNSGVNDEYGARVFVIDLEDGGKVLQKFTLADGGSSNGIENSVPARVTAITADSSNLMTASGALVYITDLEGRMWKINMTDEGTLYEITAQFDGEADKFNERHTLFGTEASVLSDGTLINIYGTGNIQQLSNIDSDIDNRVFAIYDRYFPAPTTSTPYDESSLQDVTIAGTSCPSESQDGWLVDLDENEKVTARIAINDGLIYVPRFSPNTVDECLPGSGRLTQHSFACGGETSDIDLGYGMPTEAVVYKNKVYIGISNNAAVTLPAGFVKQGNLIIGTPSSLSEGKVTIESWSESF